MGWFSAERTFLAQSLHMKRPGVLNQAAMQKRQEWACLAVIQIQIQIQIRLTCYQAMVCNPVGAICHVTLVT